MEKLPVMIEQVLEVLAEKFGTTVVHLWSVIVKQQINVGVVRLVCAVAAGLCMLVLWAVVSKRVRVCLPAESDDLFVCHFLLILATLILIITMVSCLVTGALKLANPEFYALQEVMELVKP